eukprot:3933780-Rhodomonas_salina.2
MRELAGVPRGVQGTGSTCPEQQQAWCCGSGKAGGGADGVHVQCVTSRTTSSLYDKKEVVIQHRSGSRWSECPPARS